MPVFSKPSLDIDCDVSDSEPVGRPQRKKVKTARALEAAASAPKPRHPPPKRAPPGVGCVSPFINLCSKLIFSQKCPMQETALVDMSNNILPSVPVRRKNADSNSGDDTDRDPTFTLLCDESATDNEGAFHLLG
jgi:hypothetical protein